MTVLLLQYICYVYVCTNLRMCLYTPYTIHHITSHHTLLHSSTHLGQIRYQEEEQQLRKPFQRERGNVHLLEGIVHAARLDEVGDFKQQRILLARIVVAFGMAIVIDHIVNNAFVQVTQTLMQQMGI